MAHISFFVADEALEDADEFRKEYCYLEKVAAHPTLKPDPSPKGYPAS